MANRCRLILALGLFLAAIQCPGEAPAVLGDADGNGTVDTEDARCIARFLVNQIPAVPNAQEADATQDGTVDLEDAFAIAQHVTGRSRIVTAEPHYGVPRQNQVGSIIRVAVFERFFPLRITGGRVRIRSASKGYDSGDCPLTFEEDGRSLYYHWDTGAFPPASDYEIHVELIELSTLWKHGRLTGSLPGSDQPDLVTSLEPRVFEQRELALVRDAFCPAPGIPLEFRRVFPQDHAHYPYLGPFGRGWVHNYDMSLEECTDGLIIFHGAAGLNRFFKSNADGTYNAAPGDYGVLTRDPDGTFQLREKTGLIYRFRADLLFDYMMDTNGNRIGAAYDDLDRLVKVEHSCGESFSLEYNAEGRISRLIDHAARVTTYEYWNNSQHLVTVIAPGDVLTRYVCCLGQGVNRDHRLLEITHPDGTHTYFKYDDEGRLASRSGDNWAGFTRFSYDPDGTAHVFDALNNETVIKVNEAGQPTEVRNPVGAVIRFGYDSTFSLSQLTDPLGRVYSFGYDERGNLIRATDALSHALDLGYDLRFNKMAWLKDANGNETAWEYDSHGNLLKTTYQDNSTEEYAYDSAGNVASKKNRMGGWTSYHYNGRGQCLEKLYPNEKRDVYLYDSYGNMTLAANDVTTIMMFPDSRNLLTRVEYPGGLSFSYEHDAAGKRTCRTDQDGRELNYQYDVAGRLVRVYDEENSHLVCYEYDTANRRTKKVLGNGAYTTYEYDPAGQVLRLINYGPAGNPMSRFVYAYDLAGNRLSKETIEGTEKYTYDALNQLTGVTYPDGIITQFIYDSMGNRLTLVENDVPESYTVNRLNQYISIGSTSYKYDANGNLVLKTEGGQTTCYDYDSENRLLRVRTPTDTITYTYDPFGLRNGRIDAQDTVRYLWDGDQVAVEMNETNQTVASYTWGNILDEAVLMRRGGSSYYYTQDALLSVSDLLDASGNPVEHYRYLVFGEPLVSSSLGNPWFFTGLAYDFDVELQYNRFRYYSPALGRFVTADPIGFLGGVNFYAFAFNNPVNMTDPIGRQPQPMYWPALHTWATPCLLVPALRWVAVAVIITYVAVHVVGWALGALGGGVCPTFIQLPVYLAAVALQTTYLDVSEEQLAGKITVPIEDALLRSDIPIFGVAGGREFKEYRVEYGEGKNPTEWHLIALSAIPQPSCDVGSAEMKLMQGDLDIRGNLATWNTGLKNWTHLPWHPPEDPTDLNGPYTLRLIVCGEDGQKVEDRITVEVGRVIAQCLPGVATSPDKRVTMRCPEQALMHPFRIYTILPLGEVGERIPAAPKGCRLIGSIYRIREPGDRFTKDVTLEFTVAPEEMGSEDPEHMGICRYDTENKQWIWLNTVYSDAEKTFSTALPQVPWPKAIFGLGFDTVEKRSASAPSVPDPKPPILPVGPGVLVEEAFEKDMGHWKPRDRFVGATLSRDNTATADRSYCLKLTNENQGGNFSCTVLDQPFDACDYPLMSFDYRISSAVKVDFLFRVNGRWYSLRFTDDPVNYRNRDVNIANLGRIDGVIADNRWHTASLDLGKLLRLKTLHTRVDEVAMADWNVDGYMKLEFGTNPRAATFYIDNFKIAAASLRQPKKDLVVVDSFDDALPKNMLGGPTGAFSNPGTDFCQTAFVDDVPPPGGTAGVSKRDRVLKITFDASKDGIYCGYWSALMALPLEGFRELSFRVKGSSKIPPLLIGLRHCNQQESEVPLLAYVGNEPNGTWKTVHIPLSAFRELPDLSLIDTLFIKFSSQVISGKGTILIDDIRFANDASFATVADFDFPTSRNLLGGDFRTHEQGAAAISAGYYEEQSPKGVKINGCCRISYGGTIGRDYGKQGFSYCIWETDLRDFDSRPFEHIVFDVRGERGGEEPSFYLDDGTVRRCIRAKEFAPVTTAWQRIRLPLTSFARQGVDVSHLEVLEIDFEWAEMTGTIYLDNVRFE